MQPSITDLMTEQDLVQMMVKNPSLRIKGKQEKGTVAPRLVEKAAKGTQHVASPPAKKDYKAELLQQLALVKIKVQPEFYFAKPRKFRSDWKVQGLPVLIEYDGGIFMKGKGGHSSVKGILRDIEKMNMAAIAGYLVIRVTPKHVVSGEGLQWIELAIEQAKARIAVVKELRERQGE